MTKVFSGVLFFSLNAESHGLSESLTAITKSCTEASEDAHWLPLMEVYLTLYHLNKTTNIFAVLQK